MGFFKGLRRVFYGFLKGFFEGFLWFSSCFARFSQSFFPVFLWFFSGFPKDLERLWGFPRVYVGFSNVFFEGCFLMGFLRVFDGFSEGFLFFLKFSRVSIGFC